MNTLNTVWVVQNGDMENPIYTVDNSKNVLIVQFTWNYDES